MFLVMIPSLSAKSSNIPKTISPKVAILVLPASVTFGFSLLSLTSISIATPPIVPAMTATTNRLVELFPLNKAAELATAAPVAACVYPIITLPPL